MEEPQKPNIQGVVVEQGEKYFAQIVNIGIEGTVLGVEEGKLLMKEGVEYDLREVVADGYKNAQKHKFIYREVPIDSIRTFTKKKQE